MSAVAAGPAVARAPRGPRGRWRELAMGAPLVLLLVVMLLYPVGQLLLLSVHTGQGVSLAPYRQLFASSVYVDVLLITI